VKRFVAAVVAVLFIAVSLFAMPVYAQDNVLDKMSDWAAMRGKKEPEKSMILARRRSERAAKRAEKEMRKQAKKMDQGMKKAFGQ